jgi:hypothetical protein
MKFATVNSRHLANRNEVSTLIIRIEDKAAGVRRKESKATGCDLQIAMTATTMWTSEENAPIGYAFVGGQATQGSAGLECRLGTVFVRLPTSNAKMADVESRRVRSWVQATGIIGSLVSGKDAMLGLGRNIRNYSHTK